MSELIMERPAPPVYIAVSEYGYGHSTKPALAIWRALEQVPADAPKSQMLIYAAPTEVKPRGWKDGAPVWPKPTKAEKVMGIDTVAPRLVGLTNTDTAWRARPK